MGTDLKICFNLQNSSDEYEDIIFLPELIPKIIIVTWILIDINNNINNIVINIPNPHRLTPSIFLKLEWKQRRGFDPQVLVRGFIES